MFTFKNPETKKCASSSIERYERQQKWKKVKELVLKQSKQPVEAAEDKINLVVEEETHKDKGLLFVHSNMDCFRLSVSSLLILRSSLIVTFIDVFCSGVVSNA